MSLPSISPAERARDLAALRPAIAHQTHYLALLENGLAAIYRDHPERCDLIAYVDGHAERVRHDLATLIAAERTIAEAA